MAKESGMPLVGEEKKDAQKDKLDVILTAIKESRDGLGSKIDTVVTNIGFCKMIRRKWPKEYPKQSRI